MNVENSVIAGLQKSQPKPKPNRMGSETQQSQRSPNKKPIPLPSHLAPKQKQPIAQTQPEKPKSNKMLYVIGGVALLGVIGFLFLRKK
jgi:LPXTG-motif cell wall-anchored protein